MAFYIKKLIMHNFKLFSHGEIDFTGKDLVVLDGPNGYGKTSTFDGLEYLFTGNVKRILNSKVSKGNIAFEDDCLVKYPSDGTPTYVKGVFSNEKGVELTIIRKLKKVSGKQNNPTKIAERTITSILCGDETICEDVDVEAANKEISKYLSESLIPFYDKFYYVSQEERLRFLLLPEDDRLNEIEGLFGLSEEEEIYKKVGLIKKVFFAKQKDKELLLKAEKMEVQRLKEEIEENKFEKSIEYEALLGNNTIRHIWDQEETKIDSKDKLVEMIDTVKAIGMFSKEVEWYKKDIVNKWVDSIVQDEDSLKKYICLSLYDNELSQLYDDLKKYNEVNLVCQKALLDEDDYDYEKISYDKLKELLGLDVDLEELNTIQDEIDKIRKNIKDEDGARASINKLQKKLKDEWNFGVENEYKGLSANKCPMCGQSYLNKQELLQNLDNYRAIIENGKGDSQKLLEQKIDNLKKIYETYFKQSLELYLNEFDTFKSNIYQEIYSQWDNITVKYREFVKRCSNYGITLSFDIMNKSSKQVVELVESFIKQSISKKIKLPDEYYYNNEKYKYASILSVEYNNKLDMVKPISDEKIDAKILYLEQQYYSGQQKKLTEKENEIEKISKKLQQISTVYANIAKLEEDVKQKLRDYKVKVVKQLQIPFYLYTGRILQNYPGGLGIKMKVSENEKIRFEAENRKEHDVLYTLSSGQLSAVAMSIALAMNKVYAPENAKYMFIDDPIQTMDELNIASFVEILRTDFSDYQFILSTHEEDFSDYIRYKFDRYGLGNKSIDVRKIEIQN